MRLLSFDIGIKNMAVSLFHIDEQSSTFILEDWRIFNLSEAVDFVQIENKPCTCPLSKKPAKKSKNLSNSEVLENRCKRFAKYERNGLYFCEPHAKSSDEWIIPTKSNSEQALKKLKLPELRALAIKLQIIDSASPTITKKMLFDEITAFYENRFFQILGKDVKKNAGEIDLITIGRNMKTHLDLFLGNGREPVTHVIMENQISTLATRMKTIQGMLAQYFIMIDQDGQINIECISSANKLKEFVGKTEILENTITEVEVCESSVQNGVNNTANLNTYRQHKMDAVAITNTLIEKTPNLHSWKSIFEKSKKRDDLADCFLQGLWFLRREKIITYADDLEIKIV
jgi:hypothetical protein